VSRISDSPGTSIVEKSFRISNSKRIRDPGNSSRSGTTFRGAPPAWSGALARDRANERRSPCSLKAFFSEHDGKFMQKLRNPCATEHVDRFVGVGSQRKIPRRSDAAWCRCKDALCETELSTVSSAGRQEQRECQSQRSDSQAGTSIYCSRLPRYVICNGD
jgi:hypothetical protein